MLSECINGLKINPTGTYVDATFGGGGHSRAIYEKLDSSNDIKYDLIGSSSSLDEARSISESNE